MAGWGYDGAGWSDERILAAASYAFQQWLKSPVIQGLLQRAEEGAARAVEARLAAGIAQLRNASLVVGAADLALTAGVPIAVWVGVFVALGAPYAQARTLVKNENFQSGFSQGFVTGLLKWEWQQVTSRFFKFGPGQMNGFDESLSYIASNAFNNGLYAGFIQAGYLKGDVRKALLKRLRALAPGNSAGNWSRLDQISYVIALSSAGRRTNFFKAN
jgi:hypothetical protein